MKITRMQKGWVIRLTDTEMNVLRRTVDAGMGAADWVDGGWQRDHIPPAEKRVMTEVSLGKRNWLFGEWFDRRSS